MNPLIPHAGDALLAGAAALNAVLVILVFAALIRATDKSKWVAISLLTLLVPIAGPVVGLMTLRRRARRVSTAGEAAASS